MGRWRSLTAYNVALGELDRVTGTLLEVQRVHIALPAATDLAAYPPVETAPATPSTGPVTVLDTYRQALMGSAPRQRRDR